MGSQMPNENTPHIGVASKTPFLSVPDGSAGKEPACNVGDPGSIPGLRRSFGEGNGYPLQYSCLENFKDRGAWGAAVHGVAKRNSIMYTITIWELSITHPSSL